MNCVSLVTNSCVALSCVAFDGELYYACDGFTNRVYSFMPDGTPVCECTVSRPYSALRYDTLTGGFVALSPCCRSTVYYLDSRFGETGSCTPKCCGGCIIRVGIATEGARLLLTTPTGVICCNRDGSFYKSIAVGNEHGELAGYDEYGKGTAAAYIQNGLLSVSVNGVSLAFCGCMSFRGFMPLMDTLSVAVGRNYLYTQVASIDGSEPGDAFMGQTAFFGSNISPWVLQ